MNATMAETIVMSMQYAQIQLETITAFVRLDTLEMATDVKVTSLPSKWDWMTSHVTTALENYP